MDSEIEIHPDILNIPYGDRKRIIDATEGREDLIHQAHYLITKQQTGYDPHERLVVSLGGLMGSQRY